MDSLRSLARLAIPLAALVALLFLAAGPAGRAEAGPSVSGMWHVVVTGDLPGTCESIIIQEGTALSSSAECSIVGTLAFTGTIDTATGSAVLTEDAFGAVLNLSFASDGNSFIGTWGALGLGGALSGTRTSTDTTGIDISGDWTFVFEGRDPGDTVCDATLTQTSVELTADIACPSGSETWHGSASPITGAFNLTLNDGANYGNIYASPIGDGSGAMSGAWVSGIRDAYGNFYAFPAATPVPGILSVSCEGQFGPGYCHGEPGDKIIVTVSLVAPPAEGYDGYRLQLLLDGSLPYVPAADPAAEAPACAAIERSLSSGEDGTIAAFSCAAGSAVTGETALARISFQCPEDGGAFASLTLAEDETYLTQGDAHLAPMLPWTATFDCYSYEEPPFPDPGPPYPYPYPSLPPEAYLAADVDCNGQTNPIDAALVLQLDAALIDSLPCGAGGDTTLDGSTNSIDATVILQMAAGLIGPPLEELPVVAP